MDRRTAFGRSLIIVATAILLSACTSEDSATAAGTQSWQALEELQQSVVEATGRIASDIEVAGNKHRIVVFVMSPPAAGTDLTAMQAEAARIASARCVFKRCPLEAGFVVFSPTHHALATKSDSE